MGKSLRNHSNFLFWLLFWFFSKIKKLNLTLKKFLKTCTSFPARSSCCWRAGVDATGSSGEKRPPICVCTDGASKRADTSGGSTRRLTHESWAFIAASGIVRFGGTHSFKPMYFLFKKKKPRLSPRLSRIFSFSSLASWPAYWNLTWNGVVVFKWKWFTVRLERNPYKLVNAKPIGFLHFWLFNTLMRLQMVDDTLVAWRSKSTIGKLASIV